jgi:hypothetical protein
MRHFIAERPKTRRRLPKQMRLSQKRGLVLNGHNVLERPIGMIGPGGVNDRAQKRQLNFADDSIVSAPCPAKFAALLTATTTSPKSHTVLLLRNLIRTRPVFVFILLAMALCVKALVPTGYMISASAKTMTVGLCSDGIGIAKTTTITIPMNSGKSGVPAHKGDAPCTYSVLSMAVTGAADAPLLAEALAFILALGFALHRALPRIVAVRLLPPSHGPPTRA